MRANHLYFVIALAATALSACSKKDKKSSAEGGATNFGQVVSAVADLPICSPESASQVYWIQIESKFVLCDGTSFVEITAAKGEKGDAGEKGSTGEKGETGSRGSAANSGVWVFDANDKPIGILLDASRSIILLENGGIMRIDLQTGQIISGVAVSSEGTDAGLIVSDALNICGNTQADCSGVCYMRSKQGEASMPLKGSIYSHLGHYFVATGKENLINAVPIVAYEIPGGSCASETPANEDVYAINTPYSLPEGISFPLSLPLYLGMKE